MAGRRTPLSSYSNSPNPSSHEEGSFPSGSSSLSAHQRDGHARAALPRPRLEEPPQADAVRMNVSRARVALPEWTRREIRRQELHRRLAGPSSIAMLQQLTMLKELESVEEASETDDEEVVSSQTPDSRSSSPDLRQQQRESTRNLYVSAETSSFSFGITDCSSFTSVSEGQPQGLGLADLDHLPEDYIFYLWQLAGEILNNEEGKTSKQSQWQIHELMTRCETAQDAFCRGGLNLYHDAKLAKAEFDAYVQSLRELEKFVAEELQRSHKYAHKKIRMNAMNFARNTSRQEFESAARAQLLELRHAEQRMMHYSERFHELKSLLPASRITDENELSDNDLEASASRSS
mmetsp:Transcript_45053/g.112102  ORF Transcript_45053/g.112102 Transcript_45053/m.112102 type:complete len:348 (+) Transcript_45053:19-1062(+)